MENLQTITRKRNSAREALYKIMNENEHEWQIARKELKHYETQFVILWEAYATDRNYIEGKFFWCCGELLRAIYEEKKTDEEFKKIYKPYYDKLQKLNREYILLKKQSKKEVKEK
jgi:hypothetical protein